MTNRTKIQSAIRQLLHPSGWEDAVLTQYLDGVILPKELELLDRTKENNRFHNNESVLEHTERVVSYISSILIYPEHPVNQQIPALRENLMETINEMSRGELLLLATLFHDFGKPDCIRYNGTTTSCEGHEIESARQFCLKLDHILFQDDCKYVTSIIGMHGYPHIALKHAWGYPELVQFCGEVTPSLLLMYCAELECSALPFEEKSRLIKKTQSWLRHSLNA